MNLEDRFRRVQEVGLHLVVVVVLTVVVAPLGIVLGPHPLLLGPAVALYAVEGAGAVWAIEREFPPPIFGERPASLRRGMAIANVVISLVGLGVALATPFLLR